MKLEDDGDIKQSSCAYRASMTSSTSAPPTHPIALDPQVGEIKEKETVLVTAAAGATGSFAVQLAALAGCHVIGTCGSDDKVLRSPSCLRSAVRRLVSYAPCISAVGYSMSSRSAPRPLQRIAFFFGRAILAQLAWHARVFSV